MPYVWLLRGTAPPESKIHANLTQQALHQRPELVETGSLIHWHCAREFSSRFWRMYPRSGFRSRGTCERTLVPVFVPGEHLSECTLVPVFVPGEHPPKPPFLENHPFVNPWTKQWPDLTIPKTGRLHISPANRFINPMWAPDSLWICLLTFLKSPQRGPAARGPAS